MAKIKEIIDLEKKILDTLSSDKKFHLSLDEYMKLTDMKNKVGKITNAFFQLQTDYFNSLDKSLSNQKKLDKLKEYHDFLASNDISVNILDADALLSKN